MCSKSKFAIVEWLNTKDNGKRDVIDINWLINFDESKWSSTPIQHRETEIAEWRVGKKKSWKSYDCCVLYIGEKESKLRKKLQIMDKEKEDKMVQPSDESSSSSREEEEVGDQRTMPETGPIKKDLKRQSSEKSMALMEEEIKRLKLMLAETVLQNQLDRRVENSIERSDDDISKVPLYPGSLFKVNNTALIAAKSSGNKAIFVGDMLQQLFPKHILIVSNILGGESKGQATGLHRWALNKKKKDALINAAAHYFPGTTKSQVNGIISRRINTLRFKLKNKGLLKKYEDEGKEALKDTPHKLEEDSE